MNKFLSFIFLLFFFNSCTPEPKVQKLTYQNIIMLTDMSNRISNKNFPNKDLKRIYTIVEFFKKECVKPGEKTGDRSKILFSTFTKNNLVEIDIEKFNKSIFEKQSFVNSTGKYKKSGLTQMLSVFKDSVNKIYRKESNPGLDLISLLIEKINNENLVKRDSVLLSGIDTTHLIFENNIFLFTDGYLEYSKNNNLAFYFGENQIRSIRNYCLSNKTDVKNALISNPKLGLPAYRSPLNRLINLHILETHERDKDVTTLGYKNDPGLRDNEILELVWKKWAIESGFKSFTWEKY
jgi:hypothetical protein